MNKYTIEVAKSFFFVTLSLLAILGLFALTACGPNPRYVTEYVGVPGPTGADGLQGEVGATGAPGSDAASVTIIQLCPGPVTYPTSFPEQALCIDHKLYGVYYSVPYAFLSELPPGHYSSTSPVACSLTVGLDCQVTH